MQQKSDVRIKPVQLDGGTLTESSFISRLTLCTQSQPELEANDLPSE